MIQTSLPYKGAPALDLGGIDLNRLAQQALQPWADAYDSWRSGVDALVRPTTTKPMHHHHHHHQCCECPTCWPDPCACRCCVTDADLVIEARVLERRVVPIVIENPWRRERDVELELSSFTAIVGGEVAVRAELATPAAFKLAPCGREEVVLLIGISAEKAGTPLAPAKPAGQKVAGKVTEGGTGTLPINRQELPDVSRCEVAYADLRIKGCDMRSIRIAVAVLPRTCEAFEVDCGCGCCC